VPTQYAKLLQMVQAYCIVSTGVRISCSNQACSRHCVAALIGSEEEYIALHILAECHDDISAE
jgi:hypothetical protein